MTSKRPTALLEPRGSVMSTGKGVHHHRHCHIVEGAAFEHQHLAASLLLGRGAEELHPAAEFVGDRGQRDRRARTGGADDVVPAGMADLGQRVVLRAHPDRQVTTAVLGGQRRRQIAHRAIHGETGVLQQYREPFGGPGLRERDLRIVVQRVAELQKPAPVRVEAGGDAVAER
ncbi:hypothetical protein OHA38_37365 [Streptomyces sp. NBC_01732]|uniref:hypothetical protein n=1 Tax=Streptomyces sp. NBC_01732 TaxID=2975926 RepID=UPI00352D9BE4|nr:hypothetical protein OHA38_37365 [Streptomyces sp. NBC_01732]